MKKKIISLVLTAVILAVPFAVSVSADNSGLCFIAVNDTLLDLGSTGVYSGGILYVPCKVFSSFGIYYSYFEANATAMLYNSSKQIFFELNSGNSYDSNGTTYSVSAIFKNSQVYVPVAWVCGYFGIYYSYISGIGYGDIVRIKNGGEVLTDMQFLDAATSLMRSRYNEYFGTVSPVTPAPSQPQPSETIHDSRTSVSLCFIGLPSDDMLDSLDSYGLKACFFVTAEDVSASPDTIRRICGSGYGIGIYCKNAPEKELSAASDALFDAAYVRPTMITSPPSISKTCSEYAKANGFAYCKQVMSFPANFKYVSEITSKIDNIDGYVSIFFISGDNIGKNLPYILQFITSKRISVLPMLETYA